MPQVVVYRDDFSAGVLSRQMLARVASQPYNQGLVGALNMIPTKTGSMRSVPGTYHLPVVPYGGDSRVEILYNLPGTKAFRVVFTANRADIFDMATPLAAAVASITTFTMAQAYIHEMQVLAIRGTLWITHSSQPPQTINVNDAGSVFTRTVPAITAGVGTGAAIFNSTNNYPSVIGYHAGRLFFAATNLNPNTIWYSKSPIAGAYQFDHTYANCCWTSPAAMSDGGDTVESSTAGARISFIESLTRLVVGTTRGLYVSATDYVSGADLPDLGVTSLDLVWASGAGAAMLRPVTINQTVIFAGVGGRTLYGAEWGQAGIQVADFTRFNGEILEPRIRSLAAMQNPYPSAWMTLEDGSAVVCAMDPANGLIGFSPIARSQGTATVRKNEWVAIVRGDVEDRVVWSVWETPGTSTFGLLQAPFDADLDTLGDGQPHNVDRGVYLHDAGGTDTITDAGLLNGETYDIWADWSPLPVSVAAAGALALDRTVQDAHYGLPMAVWMQPTIPDVPIQGSGQAQNRAVVRVVLRLIDTWGGAAGPDLASQNDIVTLTPGSYVLGEALPPVSGDFNVDSQPYNSTAPSIVVSQPLPAPIEVAAVVFWLAVTEVP